jgi:hypothetical protein
VTDADRVKLLGKYRTPRCRIGQAVWCEVQGEVTVCGLHDGPIPWPVGKRGKVNSPRAAPSLQGGARVSRLRRAALTGGWS